jgi:hypothetical protein
MMSLPPAVATASFPAWPNGLPGAGDLATLEV